MLSTTAETNLTLTDSLDRSILPEMGIPHCMDAERLGFQDGRTAREIMQLQPRRLKPMIENNFLNRQRHVDLFSSNLLPDEIVGLPRTIDAQFTPGVGSNGEGAFGSERRSVTRVTRNSHPLARNLVNRLFHFRLDIPFIFLWACWMRLAPIELLYVFEEK